mmetsp:Transcript_275/g.451  ORF Transcript_275/g.451 Transcript_275/m.451 type:complete len:195 (+) Transcript_275:235-819(+)
MIATLSPGSNSTDHTVNTLRYADRIKEKKVGNLFSPTNRSPAPPPEQTGKKLPLRKQAVSMPSISDELDDFDELEQIMSEETSINNEQTVDAVESKADQSEQLSEMDKTVKELFEEEENLLNLHMASIHENASLLTEEGALLNSVQAENYDIDQYASRLREILDHRTSMIHSLQDKMGSFRELLRKEEELSGMR